MKSNSSLFFLNISGTKTDLCAGHRACQCLSGFYRTHLFKECRECGQGLECKDEFASLIGGYWWKDRYIYFIANLLAFLPALDTFSVQYLHLISTPYKCPVEESCKGGLRSQYDIGYKGTLCAVCSSGYYKEFQTSKKCPSKQLMLGQLPIIVVILLVIVAILIWNSKRKTETDQRFSVIDMSCKGGQNGP